MKKRENIVVPIICIVLLIGILITGVFAGNNSSSAEEETVYSNDAVTESNTKYVLKDPVQKLEKQSDVVNHESTIEKGSQLENIINVLSEEMEKE